MFRENEINQKENEACKAESSPPAAAAPTVPPPLSPSPSHEFSFTMSLNHHNCISAPYQPDIVPADDIFFHGHLLPLEKLQNTEPGEGYNTSSNIKSKHKHSFSYLLGLTKWLRRNDDEKGESKTKKKNKKEKSSDLRCCWQKVGPSVSFKWEKEKGDLRRRPCSFSGKANDSREGSARWRWRGEFSAPASMWTSPTNSGINVASSATTTAASDESTMVELQNAVQAAIAYCKNSIAVKEEIFT